MNGSPSKLAAKWRQPLSSEGETRVVAGADVVAALVEGSHLAVFDRATGTPRWSQELSGWVPGGGPLAVWGGSLVVGDFDRNLRLLDAGDGSVVWELAIAERFTSPFTIVGDVAYVGAGDKVYALDLAQHKVRWSAVVEAGAEVWAPPTVTDQRVFVVAGRLAVAFARDRGTRVWAQQLTSYASEAYREPVAVSGSLVLTGTPAKDFVALEVDGGKRRWTSEVARGTSTDTLIVAPHVAGEHVAFVWRALTRRLDGPAGPSGEHRTRVTCLAVADGRQAWTRDLPGGHDAVRAEGWVVVADGAALHALEIATGEQRALALPWPYDDGLTVDGGELFYATPDALVAVALGAW